MSSPSSVVQFKKSFSPAHERRMHDILDRGIQNLRECKAFTDEECQNLESTSKKTQLDTEPLGKSTALKSLLSELDVNKTTKQRDVYLSEFKDSLYQSQSQDHALSGRDLISAPLSVDQTSKSPERFEFGLGFDQSTDDALTRTHKMQMELEQLRRKIGGFEAVNSVTNPGSSNGLTGPSTFDTGIAFGSISESNTIDRSGMGSKEITLGRDQDSLMTPTRKKKTERRSSRTSRSSKKTDLSVSSSKRDRSLSHGHGSIEGSRFRALSRQGSRKSVRAGGYESDSTMSEGSRGRARRRMKSSSTSNVSNSYLHQRSRSRSSSLNSSKLKFGYEKNTTPMRMRQSFDARDYSQSQKMDRVRENLRSEKQKTASLTKENEKLKAEIKRLKGNSQELSDARDDYVQLLASFDRSEKIRKQQKNLIVKLKREIEDLRENHAVATRSIFSNSQLAKFGEAGDYSDRVLEDISEQSSQQMSSTEITSAFPQADDALACLNIPVEKGGHSYVKSYEPQRKKKLTSSTSSTRGSSSSSKKAKSLKKSQQTASLDKQFNQLRMAR